MLEHQHVNMYTDRSIYLILADAGFVDIKIERGSYGNTFHVTAKKSFSSKHDASDASSQFLNKTNLCDGFIDRASQCITRFSNFYNSRTRDRLDFYVPLRCIPYLSCVGDYGQSNFSILTPHGRVNILMDIVLPYGESMKYSTKRATPSL